MNERHRIPRVRAVGIAVLVAGALLATPALAFDMGAPILVADSRGGGGHGGGGDRGGGGRSGPGGDRGGSDLGGFRSGPGSDSGGMRPGPQPRPGGSSFRSSDRGQEGRPDGSASWPDDSRRGPAMDAPSRNAIVAGRGGNRYYYDRGNWYAPRGPRYVIVSPPIGFAVTRLPPYYSTLWFGGVPYFHAGGTYYLWREHERAYEIVDAPSEAAANVPSSAPDDLYVYPKQGQDEERQSSDRYECHRWAADQTGFDPTQPDSSTERGAQQAKRDEYRRATTACLEGRGYSVR